MAPATVAGGRHKFTILKRRPNLSCVPEIIVDQPLLTDPRPCRPLRRAQLKLPRNDLFNGHANLVGLIYALEIASIPLTTPLHPSFNLSLAELLFPPSVGGN